MIVQNSSKDYITFLNKTIEYKDLDNINTVYLNRINSVIKSEICHSLIKIKDYDNCLKIIQNEFNNYPNYINSYNLGYIYYLLNDYENSIFFLKKSISNSDFPLSYYLMGNIYKNFDSQKATQCYKKCIYSENSFRDEMIFCKNNLTINMYKDNPEVSNRILKEIEFELQDNYKIQNKDTLYTNICLMYFYQKDYKRALILLEKINIKNNLYYHILSSIYYLIGDLFLSKKYLLKILNTNCFDLTALKNMIYISKIYDDECCDYEDYYNILCQSDEIKKSALNSWDFNGVEFQYCNNEIILAYFLQDFKKDIAYNIADKCIDKKTPISESLSILKSSIEKNPSPYKMKLVKNELSSMCDKLKLGKRQTANIN